jgi:DNA invertase Pin-like site-specific DNA recombinase
LRVLNYLNLFSCVMLVVWKVDRLDAPTLESLNTARDLDDRGVHIVITTLGIDLKTRLGGGWCSA